MDYYSLKMRASEEVEDETAEVLADGSRPTREQHISGAERIVTRDAVEEVCQAMVRRAMNHPKGDPDKINIKIEKVPKEEIQILDALPVTRIDVDTWQEGLEKAFELVEKSVAKAAHNNSVILSEAKNPAFLADFRQQLPELLRATFPMRGAMLYDIRTGNRLEPNQERGVRATYMDALKSNTVDARETGAAPSANKNHFNEAIVLATKVANAPGIVAELCISDDPDYVTGYVGSLELGYVRIMKLKEMGDPNGGRIFLFDSNKATAEECIDFLQKKKVLVRCP
ncbi:MAG: 6-carboxyhexanoate--CoA ligase [Fibrobacter sp.]|nr:6-carboxyhexanoate--CoA ligase [Fibrobacter sp.]